MNIGDRVQAGVDGDEDFDYGVVTDVHSDGQVTVKRVSASG